VGHCGFPLGGYVKMVDEREGEVAVEDLPRSFNRQPVLSRCSLLPQDPAANFLLAIVLYWGLFWHGTEEFKPLLSAVAASAAAAAGLEDGELVLKVAGEKVQTWQEMRWLLLQRAVDQDLVDLEVINARHEISLRRLDVSPVRQSGWEGDALGRLGLGLFRPRCRRCSGRSVEQRCGRRWTAFGRRGAEPSMGRRSATGRTSCTSFAARLAKAACGSGLAA
jgi:regulator of sigma E protease